MSRELCPKCEFILTRCLCHSITILQSPIKVVIIQFPKEKKHPLNTVNILKKNLENLIVIEDEKIDDNILFAEMMSQLKNPILFFKNEHATPLENENSESYKKIDGIIFIDGSWDKAKRIYFQSKVLQKLKTLSLHRPELSQYKIRKSPIEGGLSTIESVAYSLEKITNDKSFQNLLPPFYQMIDFQIEKMGLDTYQKFYEKKTKKKE